MTEAAHVRRKFYDLQQAHTSPIAAEALNRVGSLHGIEAEVRGRTPEERRAVGKERARPLLDSMYVWLQSTLAKLSKESDVAAAVRYALGRWPPLLLYCDEVRVEIDNNAAERALGRKNYLYASSDSGGALASEIYSLIG